MTKWANGYDKSCISQQLLLSTFIHSINLRQTLYIVRAFLYGESPLFYIIWGSKYFE